MSRNATAPTPPPPSKCAAPWALEMDRERGPPFTGPIEIPVGAREAIRHWEDDQEEGRRDDGEPVVVPPHVLLARRRAAFSMCSGQGRTLKGRDLRRVRDSVLRMTGFIES